MRCVSLFCLGEEIRILKANEMVVLCNNEEHTYFLKTKKIHIPLAPISIATASRECRGIMNSQEINLRLLVAHGMSR